jgi:sirohydrochlorin ferrochelatase
MKVVLVDNGSLEPAAHEGLRAAADALSQSAAVPVNAVSWKHSSRIPPGALRGGPAWTLAPWIRAQVEDGEREFLFVPFFISPQGAIGSALARDLAGLREETAGFSYSFTGGLADCGALGAIISERVREEMAARGLSSPAVIVVDHGGPSPASAEVRDAAADAARDLLVGEIGPLIPASMESPDGPGYAFNHPLLAEALTAPGFASGDVLIAPLFLLPGRHAGPGGDLDAIARAAEARSPGLRCHFTGLVGSHPIALKTLSRALARALGATIPA